MIQQENYNDGKNDCDSDNDSDSDKDRYNESDNDDHCGNDNDNDNANYTDNDNDRDNDDDTIMVVHSVPRAYTHVHTFQGMSFASRVHETLTKAPIRIGIRADGSYL